MDKEARSLPSLPRGYTKMPVEELERLYDEIETLRSEDEIVALKMLRKLRSLIRRKRGRFDPERMAPPVEPNAGLPAFPSHAADSLPVGGTNCLLDIVCIVEEPGFRVVKSIADDLISKTGGIAPVLTIEEVCEDQQKFPRFIARWKLPRFLEVDEIFGVFKAVEDSFQGKFVSGHKSQERPNARGWQQVIAYFDVANRSVAGRMGVYFGPNSGWDNLSAGVSVTRQFKNTTEARYLSHEFPDDFLARIARASPKKRETFVEVRLPSEKGNVTKQEDALYLIVQLAYLFAKLKRLDRRTLMAAIFKELNRVGTAPIVREKLYGMRETLDIIERTLLLPLEQPELAKKMSIVPESILEIGVKGVGKTFLAHYLMAGDYAAVFAAVDCSALLLNLEKDDASILERIDEISDESKLPVVLIIDDVDIILRKEEKTVARVLNWMQNIRQRGFYIIATTNYPEVIDDRVLEPGRLSFIQHVDLPDEENRRGVLERHMHGLPMDDRLREELLDTLAERTEGWTQRYLWELVQETARNCGLELLNGDIKGTVNRTDFRLELTHFEQALEELSRRVDTNKIRKANERIREFVEKKKGIGFTPSS